MKVANHFKIAFCGDPLCGLHIVGCEADGTHICEIIMSAEVTLNVVNECQKHLYMNATVRSENFRPPTEGREP